MTAPLKLIVSPASPYVRKVRVLIREAGREAEVEEVGVAATPLEPNPQILGHNPSGRIPVLIRPDGPAILDSRVITRFLDDRWGAGLYPAGRVWEVLTLEAVADGIAAQAGRSASSTLVASPLSLDGRLACSVASSSPVKTSATAMSSSSTNVEREWGRSVTAVTSRAGGSSRSAGYQRWRRRATLARSARSRFSTGGATFTWVTSPMGSAAYRLLNTSAMIWWEACVRPS